MRVTTLCCLLATLVLGGCSKDVAPAPEATASEAPVAAQESTKSQNRFPARPVATSVVAQDPTSLNPPWVVAATMPKPDLEANAMAPEEPKAEDEEDEEEEDKAKPKEKLDPVRLMLESCKGVIYCMVEKIHARDARREQVTRQVVILQLIDQAAQFVEQGMTNAMPVMVGDSAENAALLAKGKVRMTQSRQVVKQILQRSLGVLAKEEQDE